MKNYRILFLIILFSSFSSCNQKTNKDSRQFENFVETTALTKDSKELTLNTRNFYVFESTGKELFDEKGYFIDKNAESEYLVEAIVRSNVRSIIGKYDSNQLITIDKSEIGKQIEDLSHSMKFEIDNESKFDIRFNAIFVEKIDFKKD